MIFCKIGYTEFFAPTPSTLLTSNLAAAMGLSSSLQGRVQQVTRRGHVQVIAQVHVILGAGGRGEV